MSLYTDLLELFTPYANAIKSKANASDVYTKQQVDDAIDAITIPVDDTLTQEGEAADAKAVGDKIDEIKAGLDNLDGQTLTPAIKNAILDCIYNSAWSSPAGMSYYNTLHSLFYPVSSPLILATYSSGSNIVKTTDNLSTLKQYLTVLYFQTRTSTGVAVPSSEYTLSGVLTSGTNRITVSYNNLSTEVIVNNVVDTWEWSGTSSVMSIRAHAITAPNAGSPRKLKLTTPSIDNRHVAVCDTGSLYYYDAGVDTINKNVCPFPVPATATGFTVATSNTANKIVGYLFKHVGNQLCNLLNESDATWKTGGVHTSVGFTAQTDLYLGVCINHGVGVDPGNVTIRFT